eukprot:34778-Eustigmatos_ZCMA.PRE.1
MTQVIDPRRCRSTHHRRTRCRTAARSATAHPPGLSSCLDPPQLGRKVGWSVLPEYRTRRRAWR